MGAAVAAISVSFRSVFNVDVRGALGLAMPHRVAPDTPPGVMCVLLRLSYEDLPEAKARVCMRKSRDGRETISYPRS